MLSRYLICPAGEIASRNFCFRAGSLFPKSLKQWKMDGVTVPDYRDGILFLRDCLFRKMSLPATLYEGEQAKVISRNLIWDGLENESI